MSIKLQNTTLVGEIEAEECGLHFSRDNDVLSYPAYGNEACFEVEDHSFWFRHRNHCIQELVRKFPPNGKGPIFDVGAGNGFLTWNV